MTFHTFKVGDRVKVFNGYKPVGRGGLGEYTFEGWAEIQSLIDGEEMYQVIFDEERQAGDDTLYRRFVDPTLQDEPGVAPEPTARRRRKALAALGEGG